MRVLVVEDDARLAELLLQGLRAEGYAVDHSATVEEAHWFASEFSFDAMVVDIGLPDGDGIDLSRRLRAEGRWAPILLLTARQGIGDRVLGLDAGADDYLVKPFAFAELVARLRALIRRGAAERPAILQAGSLRIDPSTRRVTVGDETITLTGRAYSLLELLVRRGGQVVTRSEITEHLWDWTYDAGSNVVDVYVSTLRSSLRDRSGAPVIETVRGVGYRLSAPSEGVGLPGR